jgi:hypothetical protein
MYHYLLLLLFIFLMMSLKEGYTDYFDGSLDYTKGSLDYTKGSLDYTKGSLDYTELPLEPDKKNCPQIHVYNYNRLANRDKRKDFFGEENLWESYPDQQDLKDKTSNTKSVYQMIQPFGYTKNELFDMTRLIETDIPLPTDPDFFKYI